MKQEQMEERIKSLEQRVEELEGQMATCLRWMRRQAEEKLSKVSATHRKPPLPSS